MTFLEFLWKLIHEHGQGLVLAIIILTVIVGSIIDDILSDKHRKDKKDEG